MNYLIWIALAIILGLGCFSVFNAEIAHSQLAGILYLVSLATATVGILKRRANNRSN